MGRCLAFDLEPRTVWRAVIEVTYETNGTWLLARVVGSLDAVASPRLLEELEARTPPAVALDLSAVTFIDSAGIEALLELRARHGRLRLRAPSGVVRRVLSLLDLLGEFEVVDGGAGDSRD